MTLFKKTSFSFTSLLHYALLSWRNVHKHVILLFNTVCKHPGKTQFAYLELLCMLILFLVYALNHVDKHLRSGNPTSV